jgi:hypothetical protein
VQKPFAPRKYTMAKPHTAKVRLAMIQAGKVLQKLSVVNLTASTPSELVVHARIAKGATNM